MIVQADGKAPCLAVEAARHDDRRLAGKIDQRFEDAFAPAELLPGRREAGSVGDAELALAVIAFGASLQDAGQRRGGRDVGLAADRLMLGGADAELGEKRLLAQA